MIVGPGVPSHVLAGGSLLHDDRKAVMLHRSNRPFLAGGDPGPGFAATFEGISQPAPSAKTP